MTCRAGQRTHGGRVLWITSYLHLCSADPCPLRPAKVSPEAKRLADEAIERAYARVRAGESL